LLGRVFVTRRIDKAALGRLAAHATVDVWRERLPPSREMLSEGAARADALLTLLTDRIDGALLDRAPTVRVVANMASGYDNLALADLTERRIAASNTPDVLTDATADLTWALILAAARRLGEGDRALRAGAWRTWEPDFLTGLDLCGATLGIVGLGRIGAAVARRAHGFGMRVVAWSRTRPTAPGVDWRPLHELLAGADVVTIHCALTAETTGLIGARELALMKPTAVLVNTARAEIVDHDALLGALASGRIAAAGLDVFDTEPLPLDDPLLGLPNVILLPHLGSATVGTRARMANIAVDNVLAGLRGERLPNCVNPEVYDLI